MLSLSKPSRSGLTRFLLFTLLLAPALGRADTASDLRAFTGAPTRVVWIQDAGPTACVYSEKPTIRVMGFDTEDGKGERAILPAIGWYAKPQLTADGQRVIYHDLTTNTVNVVNFDGTGMRQVVKNAGEFEDDATWTDPKTGVVWVYAQIIEQRNGQPVPTIRRFQLDHPEISELIWDKTPAHMFMLSGDGRVASGGIGNGGNTPQGVFTLPNGNFYQRGGGCWPSMSPDNSHRSWVFTGNHRSIHFCIPTNRSGAAANFAVRFEAPGLVIQNGEEMYHPRWTNNVRYVCLDSPFSQWSWKSDAKIPMDVAAKVEIYVGKFKDDFSGIEKWVQVTHNTAGDYWPNVWIKPSASDLAALNASPAPAEEKPTAPPDNKGLVYVWITGGDSNQLTNPATGAIHQCSGQFRDEARFGSYNVMDLTGGAFVPDDATPGPLLAACKSSNQFAAETVVTPTGTASSGETVIMAFADDPANGNFVLSEKGDQLLLRLKTDASPTPASIPVCRLLRARPNHLIVSYADGRLACYLNGKPVSLPTTLHGNLSTWTTQPLLFGDAAKGGANWTGLMENIGLFSREIGAPEARQRYLQYRQHIAARQPIETVIMDAKLIGRCPAADPQGIAPYRRCLSVQLYEVDKVISGTCKDAKISVAQWSVLDGKVVPAYLKLAVGQTYRLALEKMDDHPEQQSERTISGDFDADNTQLYYEVRTPDAPPPPLPAETAAPQPTNLVIGANAPAIAGATTITDGTSADLTSIGTAQLAGQGTVAGATVINDGFGYTSAPQVTFSGGGGQGATGAAIMGVGSLDLTSVGSGYTSEPSVTIAPPDVPGGRTAKATARIDKASASIAGLNVIDPGTGYLKAPQVTFAGGGGSGAAADANLSLTGIIITNGGSGYTAPPSITLDGDGQDASAQGALQIKTFRVTTATAPACFTNSGNFTQDGSAVVIDWAVPARPTGKRGFDNGGTWTLKNGSVIRMTSSSGQTDGLAYITNNTGTMSAVDGSKLGFQQLQNSGELDLGAGVVLGQAEFAQIQNIITNTGKGICKITGSTPDQPVTFGYIGAESTGQRVLENGTRDGASQAQLIVGSGNDTSTFVVIGGQVDLTNFAGCDLEIAHGAQLNLITNDNGSPHPFVNRDAKITNAGNMVLAGNLRVQGNHGGYTGIENSGQLTLRGQITLERLRSSTGPGGFYSAEATSEQIQNQPGSVLQGIGAATYQNSTESPEGRYLKVSNLGTIAPGEPAAGSTPESYGVLALANAHVYFGAFTLAPKTRGEKPGTPTPAASPATPAQPGILRIGIAGPPTAPDRFDSLVLTGPDDCGELELVKGEGNTLNIVPGAGFTPHGTYRIVSATSVVGTFDTLQYNGAAQVPYTVNYLPDGIEAVFP